MNDSDRVDALEGLEHLGTQIVVADRLERLVSTADEFSPNVANENSPLRCGLVASVSAWRFDVGEFG